MSSLNKVSSFNNFHICLLSHLRVKFDGQSGLDDSARHIPVSIQLGLSLCTDRNSPVKATSKCWHVLWQAKASELFRNIKLCDEPLLSTLRLQLRTDWTLPRIKLRKTGNSTKHSKLSQLRTTLRVQSAALKKIEAQATCTNYQLQINYESYSIQIEKPIENHPHLRKLPGGLQC